MQQALKNHKRLKISQQGGFSVLQKCFASTGCPQNKDMSLQTGTLHATNHYSYQCMVSPLGKPPRFQHNTDSFNALVGTTFCYFLSHFTPEQGQTDLTDSCSIFFRSSTKDENDISSESTHFITVTLATQNYYPPVSMYYMFPSLPELQVITEFYLLTKQQKHFSDLAVRLICAIAPGIRFYTGHW